MVAVLGLGRNVFQEEPFLTPRSSLSSSPAGIPTPLSATVRVIMPAAGSYAVVIVTTRSGRRHVRGSSGSWARTLPRGRTRYRERRGPLGPGGARIARRPGSPDDPLEDILDRKRITSFISVWNSGLRIVWSGGSIPFHIIDDPGNEVGIFRDPVLDRFDVARGEGAEVLLDEPHDLFGLVVGVVDPLREEQFLLVAYLLGEVFLFICEQELLRLVSLLQGIGGDDRTSREGQTGSGPKNVSAISS